MTKRRLYAFLSMLLVVLVGCVEDSAPDASSGDAAIEAGTRDGGAGTRDGEASDDGSSGADGGGSDGGDADGSADAGSADAGSADAGSTSVDELSALPRDTGGTHTPHPLGTTAAAFGYYLYLPGGYDDTALTYPLIVFLHGRGERGNGDGQLGRVLVNGIPRVIENGSFAPSHPMIVASPQYPSPDGVGNENNWGEGDPSQVRGFIEHLIATYRVNTHRIYLTGLSHGGNGTYDYLTGQNDATSYLAAAVPVAAWGPSRNFANARHTPIWVFVGSNDANNFRTSGIFVNGYNAQDPAPTYPARFTVYPEAGHNVWARTYDLSGMGTGDPAYDPYDVEVYDWMLQYRRD